MLAPMLGFKLLALRALAAAADTGASSSDPCYADGSNTFTVSLDEAGSWKFLECGDTAMPVLALEKGVTYTFEQRDASVPARKLQPGRGARAVRRVAATAIGRKRRSNWNYPLAFGTDPSQGDDALPNYASGVQVDKDAYEDAFVVAQADWLDASGQDQDESEDTSEPDESEDSEEDTTEDEDEGEGGDESRKIRLSPTRVRTHRSLTRVRTHRRKIPLRTRRKIPAKARTRRRTRRRRR